MTAATTSNPHESEAITRGVLVRVTPTFMPERSDPDSGRWVFAYHIRITNQTDRAVQLLSRRWSIVDADGQQHHVEGEGVVGRQPVIEAGNSFEYSSFCPLATSWGTMEGTYQVKALDGELFDIRIARFFLVSPSASMQSS